MLPPDAAQVRAFLARAGRRLATLSALEGAAGGLAIATVLNLAGWPSRATAVGPLLAGLVVAALGVVTGLLLARRVRRMAPRLERRAPQCRNVLVTAEELWGVAHGATPLRDHVHALVQRDAARLAKQLDLAALLPARRAVGAVAASAALWTGSVVSSTGGEITGPAESAVAVVDGVDVMIVPPAYTGQPERLERNPSRVQALVGSVLRLSVRSNAATVGVETQERRARLERAGGGPFAGDVPVMSDGFIALVPVTAAGAPGPRRLIGVSALVDHAPRVRLSAPGRDLVLPNGRHAIDVTVDADDDLALVSLRLRYTRVSGSGERFTFAEGEVPLDVRRTDARTWQASARWRLDSLALGPGDMVAYRAVATDARPGATPSESDTYLAEVAAPGGVAAAGFALDPDQERYALSQQMVILKTERLLARRTTTGADAFASDAAEIAVEQRRVRAEFVFMMGGEMSDAAFDPDNLADLNEEAEAEAEGDLAADRLANQGRVSLLRSIRAMSRASRALTSADVATALTHERTALTHLERAFSRSRIILRALAERERLDASRRLTGELADAAPSTRPRAIAEPDALLGALRGALGDLLTIARAPQLDASRLALVAERVLRTNPSSPRLQDVAATLSSAAGEAARSRAVAARAHVDSATIGLARELRGLPAAPLRARSPESGTLDGALTDALRRAGRRSQP